MSDLAIQLARRFQPRHLFIVLAAVIATFAALDLVYRHALDSLIAFQLEDSDPAVRNSFPAVVMALFLSSAGVLAFATQRLKPTSGVSWWRLAGVVLLFFAVEEFLGAHTWIHIHQDVSWNIAYLPFLAVATVVWVEVLRVMGDNRLARTTFALGVAGWLGAGLFDAARTGRESALPAGELLELAAAAAMMLGMYQYARAASLSRSPVADLREESLAIASTVVSRLNVQKLLIGIAAFMIVFGILGSIVYPGGGALRAFDLNKEQTFPATFSGILLLGAGGLALLNGVVRCPNLADRRWWLVLAGVFAFLGIDEITALHEAVQDRVHIWGQTTLIPIVIAGGIAWLITLKRLGPQSVAGRLLILAAATWAVSQGIDLELNERWGWTIVPEELLEMAGSTMFGLAMLVAVRDVVGVKSPVASRSSSQVTHSGHESLQAAR
jgi:hypothetical protein